MLLGYIYSSTSYLLFLLVALMIWNFNIILIMSGLCQVLVRRYYNDDDIDYDVSGDDERLEEARPLVSQQQRRRRRRRRTRRRDSSTNNEGDYQTIGTASNFQSSDDTINDRRSTNEERTRIRPSQQQQQAHPSEGVRNQDNDHHHLRQSTEEQLAQTYDVIYRPVTERYLEGEEARTWMWLIGALMINIVCIRIELILFDSLLSEYDDDDYDGDGRGAGGGISISSNITDKINNITVSYDGNGTAGMMDSYDNQLMPNNKSFYNDTT
jgi:hypothetical protein